MNLLFDILVESLSGIPLHVRGNAVEGASKISRAQFAKLLKQVFILQKAQYGHFDCVHQHSLICYLKVNLSELFPSIIGSMVDIYPYI